MLRIAFFCDHCGFMILGQPIRRALGNDCLSCGGYFRPSWRGAAWWANCLAVAAFAPVAVARPENLWRLFGLAGAGLAAAVAASMAACVLMRRVLYKQAGVVPLAAALSATVLLSAAGTWWAGGGATAAGWAASLTVAGACAAGGALGAILLNASARNSGRRAIGGGMAGAVLGGLGAAWLSSRAFPGLLLSAAPWWSALLGASAVVGAFAGFVTPHRPLRIPGGALSAEERAMVEDLCRRGGTTLRPFVLRRLQSAARQRGLTLAVYCREAFEDPARCEEALGLLSWGMTWFFREPEVLDRLAGLLRKGEGPLRIKVIGASTGEEAYSLAIVAAESGRPEVSIDASDLSPANIAVASRASYDARAFVLPSRPAKGDKGALSSLLEHRTWGGCRVRHKVIERYFDVDSADVYRPKAELRRAVNLRVGNVLEDTAMAGYDLVFFRNVLTHLTEEQRQTLLRRIHHLSDARTVLVLGQDDIKAMKAPTLSLLADLYDGGSDVRQYPILSKRPVDAIE